MTTLNTTVGAPSARDLKWQHIKWKAVKYHVRKLQLRIAKAISKDSRAKLNEPIPIFAKHAFRVFFHIFQSHFLAYVFKYVLRSGSKICEKILQKSKFWNIGIGS